MATITQLVYVCTAICAQMALCMNLGTVMIRNGIPSGAVRLVADNTGRRDETNGELDTLTLNQYLTEKEKEYLLNRKREEIVNQKACRPILTVLTTYTHERGSQSPKTIATARCQGGVKNPENYQCQPSEMVIECFHTKNDRGEDDFLGVYSHERCEERCICGRKSCKSKQIYNLICPKGFHEDKGTCQCLSTVGESIFYRSMGMIADWDTNLHRLCRSKSKHHKTKMGQGFKLKLV